MRLVGLPVVHSNSVQDQLVQGLFDTPSEFLTAGNDFHTGIVEVFAVHFHLGVFEVVGTLHLRSQVRTTSFDSFSGHPCIEQQLLFHISTAYAGM